MITAWVAERGVQLGQIATDEKSNEITAIPELLDTLDVRGATVTIDAEGCQKKIAEKIVDGGANYLTAASRRGAAGDAGVPPPLVSRLQSAATRPGTYKSRAFTPP